MLRTSTARCVRAVIPCQNHEKSRCWSEACAKESITRKVANALVTVAPRDLNFTFVDIGSVSHYNQDLEASPPADWDSLRGSIRAADALLFVTAEYNRSIPGVLKNAIDVASRPYGKNTFDKNPGAVVSVSPGQLSAFGANHHLRQTLVFLNVPTLQQPEAYIGGADKLFDDTQAVANESTRVFMASFMAAFASWIERCLA